MSGWFLHYLPSYIRHSLIVQAVRYQLTSWCVVHLISCQSSFVNWQNVIYFIDVFLYEELCIFYIIPRITHAYSQRYIQRYIYIYHAHWKPRQWKASLTGICWIWRLNLFSLLVKFVSVSAIDLILCLAHAFVCRTGLSAYAFVEFCI